MVEYGNGVSQGTGAAGGHGGGSSVDVGAAIGDWISNAGHTIATMPPAELVVLIVAVIAGLLLIRRLVF